MTTELSSINLNIDDYNLDDLLNLFNLNYDFEELELKTVKKSVLKMHPDKSKLDKKFFLFFLKAYNILCYIYKFKAKHATETGGCIDYDDTEFHKEDDEKRLKKFMKSASFNKDFNKLFEQNVKRSDFDSFGYDEWIQSNETVENGNNKISSLSQMGNAFQEERMKKRALIKYNGIQEMQQTGGLGGTDLTMSKPENYSSDLFSKLQYEDLRKAHEENVVPVLESDVNREYNTFEQLTFQRGAHAKTYVPMDGKDLDNHIKEKKYNDSIKTTERAYKLAKQVEESKTAQENFIANFKYLTH